MSAPHYVIIGNGSAGNRAADTLRKSNAEIGITIISAEPTHFLIRRKLAPFLLEDSHIESLSCNPPEWYSSRKIQLRLNQPVARVNPRDKTILLAHREIVKYDKLLIASGARHRVPEYLSQFAQHLTRFSTGRDAITLRGRLPQIKHITLLGGDCIALQLIWALLPAGKKISMLMDENRFWPLEFGEMVRNRLVGALLKKGVEVVVGNHGTEVERKNGGLTVRVRDGKTIQTDAAILTCGMLPSLDFLETSGVDVQEGVLVNERLESSVENIWAAGECAQIYYPEIKDYRCSTGFVNAESQGGLAALNMLGGSKSAVLGEPGKVRISGEEFITYGWKGFNLDEKN